MKKQTTFNPAREVMRGTNPEEFSSMFKELDFPEHMKRVCRETQARIDTAKAEERDQPRQWIIQR